MCVSRRGHTEFLVWKKQTELSVTINSANIVHIPQILQQDQFKCTKSTFVSWFWVLREIHLPLQPSLCAQCISLTQLRKWKRKKKGGLHLPVSPPPNSFPFSSTGKYARRETFRIKKGRRTHVVANSTFLYFNRTALFITKLTWIIILYFLQSLAVYSCSTCSTPCGSVRSLRTALSSPVRPAGDPSRRRRSWWRRRRGGRRRRRSSPQWWRWRWWRSRSRPTGGTGRSETGKHFDKRNLREKLSIYHSARHYLCFIHSLFFGWLITTCDIYEASSNRC